MKKVNTILLITMLILFVGPLAADETNEAQAMLQEAEMARAKAETARQAATEAAERARLTQREDVETAREELSRAHRVLREASLEIARAHRELSRSGQGREVRIDVNPGDRAVIGVVLGRQTPRGVQLMGVSPDGPAERAGLQPGDVVTSIHGYNLVDNNEARQVAIESLRGISDGDAVAITAERDGQTREYIVTAEQREPRSWQSFMRIPETPVVADSPESVHRIVETITIPEINQAALVAEIEELAERIESREFNFISEDFSEIGGQAMSDALIWFGLPQAHGLELTTINQGLGTYFKTDRGVLVIEAREGNAYEFQAGDVILAVGEVEVNTPSDLMRALRDVQPGSAIAIDIKRDRKDKTLQVTVPENRLGFRSPDRSQTSR